jgi:uncharacterized cupredoxin-like copper-binding protein
MRWTPTSALTVACLLAGCGSGGGGGGGKPVTVAAGKPVAVTATDYSFAPKTIVVTGAGPIRFQLKNAGAQAHDLHVTKGGADLGGTAVFGPGETQSATVRLKPGSYEFLCTVGDHAQLGMKGELTVR